MEKDLYNGRGEYQNLICIMPISENRVFKNSKINVNIDDLDLRSISTHKNSADSLNSLNSNRENEEIPLSLLLNSLDSKHRLTNISTEEPKKRVDNFGNEIKKGGKHKIAFADDLDIIKSLTPENERLSKRRKTMKIQKNFPPKKLNSPLADSKQIKRSKSFIIDRASIKKNLYNISKFNSKSKKKFNENLVQIIDVENLKKENKLNTFSFKKRKELAEEENVSCSCYCSIW